MTLALFIFGNTKTPLEEAFQKMQKASPETASETAKKVDFPEILNQMMKKLPSSSFDSLTLQLEKLDKARSAEKIPIYKELIAVWEDNLAPGPVAYYLEQIAMLESKDTSWYKAGDQYLIASKISKDSLLNPWYGDKAIASFDKSIEIAPENLQGKVGKAKTFIEGKNEVMRGVFLLREVVETDSTHSEANLLLGRLAVFSGQHDKAIKRLKQTLAKDENNSEALYYMGEAHLALDNKELALDYFKKCRALVKSPSFRKELDSYINNIIKQ